MNARQEADKSTITPFTKFSAWMARRIPDVEVLRRGDPVTFFHCRLFSPCIGGR